MRILRRAAIAVAAAVVLAPTSAGAFTNGPSPARNHALARDEAFHALLRANARPRTAVPLPPPAPVGPTVAGAGAQYQTVASAGRIARDTSPPQPDSEPDTQVEPDIAVSPLDPRIIVATFQQGRFKDGGSVDPGFATSHDGGVTWRHGNLPHLTTAVGGRWDRASDPVVAFAPGGRVYIQTLVINVGCENGVAVQRSDDGGFTWTDPFMVQEDGCEGFNDKNWMTVDTSPTSPHRGRVYSVWDRSTAKGQPQLLRWSDDGGAHWGPLVHVTDGHAFTIGAQPVVQPNGAITNVYYRYAADGVRLVAKTSHDGGATFTDHVLIDHAVPSEPADMRTGALPSATVDPVTGHLFAVWQDVRFRTDGLNDVVVTRSTDGGRSWLFLGRVNAESALQRRDNFTPDVAARDGRVFVTYRTRSNKTSPSMFVDERFVSSPDDGRSFNGEVVLGPTADLRYAARSRGFFLGDYMGVVVGADGAVHAVWCLSAAPPSPERYFQTAWSATILR